jgi:hypothetical protein
MLPILFWLDIVRRLDVLWMLGVLCKLGLLCRLGGRLDGATGVSTGTGAAVIDTAGTGDGVRRWVADALDVALGTDRRSNEEEREVVSDVDSQKDCIVSVHDSG